jgi:2-polyprenyl-3-methyl-5-hydroxy-6-metoxy-1,4-benzoquinol methylase
MEQHKCTLCGCEKAEFFLRLKTGQQIFICPTCKNAFTVPAPSATYDNHSFFTLAAADEPTWRLYSRQIVLFIQKHLATRGVLLDIGCCHGLLLEEAQSIGFQVEGIEPSRAAVDYCTRKGLKVTPGYLIEGAFSPESFDVVVMSHVLEHVADPIKLLQTVRKILKPKGNICLSQTNYKGTLPRFLGRRWGGWGGGGALLPF